MHPGPMNRGVEIAPEVADLPNAVITQQVANGVAVRMAVLYWLLGSGVHLGVADRCVISCSRAPPSSTPTAPGGPTSWSSDGRIAAVGTDLSARRGARLRRLRRGSRPRRPPHPPARAGARGGRDDRDGFAGRRPRRVHRGRGHAQHGAGDRLGRRRAPGPGPRSRRGAVRGRTSPAPSPSAGPASGWRRWPRWRPSACGCSPTTAPACRTAASCAGPSSTPPVSGSTLAQHCEDDALAAGGHMHEGEWSSRLGIPGQPAEAEELMVQRDIALARLTGAQVHFQHLSTAGSVELVRAREGRRSAGHRRGDAAPLHAHRRVLRLVRRRSSR